MQPVEPDLDDGKPLALDRGSVATAKRRASARMRASQSSAAEAEAVVGEVKTWLANDFTAGPYVKDYTLRGVGDHIQVWVAEDRAFPAGDCRNDLGLTEVTDAQVNGFVTEFDTNIYPKESAAFSVPPDRDGSDAPLAGILDLPADYYQVTAAEADDIVVLVDNVRDANFDQPTTPNGQTYVAGFFSSGFNELANRNVMTIDTFDWLHRTGAAPPDDSADADYAACTSALSVQASRAFGLSRPRLYEAVFAHEYQHLLESYADQDEVNWVNEGLSDYAQTLVGYVDPHRRPDDPSADGHIAAFLGFVGESFGGPENSLTQWEDQGAPETLADYGAAYTMMEYLRAKYGPGFLSELHREAGNGLQGLDNVLDAHGATRSAQRTVRDWAAAMALDTAISRDRRWAPNGPFAVKTLQARVNWETDQAFGTPGAPPNGSDYVRFRDDSGRYIAGRGLRTLRFRGARTLAPTPVEWSAVSNPPDAVPAGTACGAVPGGAGDAALYSGCGSDLDRAIVRTVSVPSGTGARLTFDALWDIEAGWDFGFVQASSDGGATWTSLPATDTTTDHDPDAIATVTDNLPGFTGSSAGWRSQSVDLSAYAGQQVLLAFRYVTDPAVDGAGFWVRHIDVGGTAIAPTTEGWQSRTQIKPVAVAGFTVQLVGLRGGGRVHYKALRLTPGFRATMRRAALVKALGKRSRLVGAIVTQDDPSETVTQYARYRLVVNGDLQPGG